MPSITPRFNWALRFIDQDKNSTDARTRSSIRLENMESSLYALSDTCDPTYVNGGCFFKLERLRCPKFTPASTLPDKKLSTVQRGTSTGVFWARSAFSCQRKRCI